MFFLIEKSTLKQLKHITYSLMLLFSILLVAPVNFTEKLNTLDYAYLGNSKAMLCCAEGYDIIKWYRKDGNQWTRLTNGFGDLIIAANGQWLQLSHVELADQTIFRCDLVKNNATVASHSVSITVQGG